MCAVCLVGVGGLPPVPSASSGWSAVLCRHAAMPGLRCGVGLVCYPHKKRQHHRVAREL